MLHLYKSPGNFYARISRDKDAWTVPQLFHSFLKRLFALTWHAKEQNWQTDAEQHRFPRISVTAFWRFERKQMAVQDQERAKILTIFKDQHDLL